MSNQQQFVPGKVILSGEHAVVYGKMALAASISLGVLVSVVESDGSEKTEIVQKAIEVAGGNENNQVKIESELPVGSGLGSSAAVAAATIKAVKDYLGQPTTTEELFELTMECEKLAHGNPSGVDPAVVIYGGLVAYTKGQPIKRIKLEKPIKILLVDSGRPSESTRAMVELVAQNPAKIKIIDQIGVLVEQIKLYLERGDEIRDLLNKNGLLLEDLGVVGSRASRLSKKLREMGASVKITGAGGVKTGSGMMMVMGDGFGQIKNLLDNIQITYFETVLGET